MAISGRKSKMATGRLDNAIVQMTNSQWVEETTKNGKDVVQLEIVFVDQDEKDHKVGLILGDQKYVRVEDGKLASVDDTRDYQMSSNSPAGKFLASLEDAGFSGKKLDAIGDNADVLDGQWVHVIQKASSNLKTDGTPFTDLIVDELVEDPTSSKSAKKSTTAKAGAPGKGKASVTKAAPVEDEDDEDADDDEPDADTEDADDADAEDADDDEDGDDADPATAAAQDMIQSILADPKKYVRNFDEDANDGGISVKQAYNASFTAFKGDKKLKGPASNLISDPAFHKANAKAGLYQFDAKTGVITAAPAAPKKRK